MVLTKEQEDLLLLLNTDEEKEEATRRFVLANRRRMINDVSVPITKDIGDVSTIGFVQDIRVGIESI